MKKLKIAQLRCETPITYIGDIHGQLNAFHELISKIPKNNILIFTGDVIDGGYQSKKTLETVIYLLENRPQTYLLWGNHESHLCGAADLRHEEQHTLDWFSRKSVGYSCLLSYGWTPHSGEDLTQFSARKVQQIIREHIPLSHIEKLKKFSYDALLVNNKFFFVHGSLDPDKDISEHTLKDTFQPAIRHKFLSENKAFKYKKKKVVVLHGHSPIGFYPKDIMPKNQNVLRDSDGKVLRVNVDNGASFGYTGHKFGTGYLSAISFEPCDVLMKNARIMCQPVFTPTHLPHPKWVTENSNP